MERRIEMKKIVCIAIVIVASLVALVGLFMIINGSLEMMPTAEQIEKVHIAGWGLLVIGSLIDLFAVVIGRNIK